MRPLVRLLALFRSHWGWLALGVLLSFVTLIANVGLMATSGWFIAAMGIAGVGGVSMNYFTPAAIIRAFAIVRTAGRYGERLVTHEATLRVLSRLRVWFYEHLEPLAPARLLQYRSGDLLTRIRADIDTLDNFYLRVFAPTLVALFSTFLFVVLLTRYGTPAALVELLFLTLGGALIPGLVMRRSRELGKRRVELSSRLRAHAVDGLQGLDELLIYGATGNHRRQLNEVSEALIDVQGKMSHLNGLSQGGVGLCANLAMWSITLLATPMVRAGGIPPAELAMLALFALASFEALLPLPQAYLHLGETLAAARRIFAVVDAEPEVREPPTPSPRIDHFDIRFEEVGYRYAPDQVPVLEAIGFDLPQGQRLAIVGPTGSGKSTLAHLLLGFHRPAAGRILLGGQRLEGFHGEDLRRYITLVSQHTHLFNTTVRENLLIARPHATQAELEAACHIARIHDVIAALPEGYDTFVGEAGRKISGGEARRIAIARALLRDAPILILDEPTEGLDAPTERAVMGAIHWLMKGRTVILITHRLGGLSLMDEILLLDRGRILARGTESELLTHSDAYQRLHTTLATFDETLIGDNAAGEEPL